MISSAANRRVKHLSRLLSSGRYRHETKTYVAEGLRVVREAPVSLIEELYAAESFDMSSLDKNVSDIPVEILSDEVFDKISDTVHSQGIIAVVRMNPREADGFYDKDGMYLVTEDIRDPGNLGTMIRTAEAAGIDGIVMCGSTTDVFSPKVVRAAMGSLYRLPYRIASDIGGELSAMEKAGITTFAATPYEADEYTDADYRIGCAFLIGNEAAGLSDDTIRLAKRRIMIPMRGKTESLNAAMAAGILMFEANRQRRLAK